MFVEDSLISKIRRFYFHRLLNNERDKGFVLEDLENLERYRDYCYCRHIKVDEVKGIFIGCVGVGRLS